MIPLCIYSPDFNAKGVAVAHRNPCEIYHREDSVIESPLREIIESKQLSLSNLSLNFCETAIYDDKVFLENLVAVH